MKKLLIYFTAFVLLFTPVVSAQSIDHFYTKADEEVSFNEEVNGSVAIAGANVENEGNVRGASFLAGNKIEHKGQSDYLVIAGNSIEVEGMVLNDTLIAGNLVDIKKEALLERDTVILASDIEVEGTVGRNITIYGGKVSFKGASISGNVRVFAESITVDDDTVITGTLSYPSDAKVSISSNITNIKKTSPIQTEDETVFSFLMSKVWGVMSLIFIFALLSLFAPKLFELINKKYEKVDFNKATDTFTKGLVFLIVVPLSTIMLLMLPFGVSLSFILIALYFIIIYLAKVFVGYLVGYKLWQRFVKSDVNVLLVGILGFAVLFVLDLIPGINALVSLFVTLFGIGIIINFILDAKKS